MSIVALHGFLGSPKDWDNFKDIPIRLKYHYFDPHLDILSFDDFVNKFNHDSKTAHEVLMGYSMGGRLALHALIDSPKKWKAAILISTHPGLASILEREERLKSDHLLLKSFLEGDFETNMNKWNKNPLFNQSDLIFKRKEKEISENTLRQYLSEWSLGKQEDLRKEIAKLNLPILWVVGQNDQKYLHLSSELNFLHPKSRVWIAKNSWHRVPWEIQEEFQKEVNTFLEGL